MLCDGTKKSESELESGSELKLDEKETGLESGTETDLESESEMGLGSELGTGLRSELGFVLDSVGSTGSVIRISSSLSVSRAMTQSSDSVVRDVRDVIDGLGDGTMEGPEGSFVFVVLAPFLKTLTAFFDVSVAFLVVSRVVGAMVVVFKKKKWKPPWGDNTQESRQKGQRCGDFWKAKERTRWCATVSVLSFK